MTADIDADTLIDLFTEDNAQAGPVSLMERLAQACLLAGKLAPKGGSFALNVHNYEWNNSESTVNVSLHGRWGIEIAKAHGVEPGEWYGFESSYKGEDQGSPQRNYDWKIDGVRFSAIESVRDSEEWTFEKAVADFASRQEEREIQAAVSSGEIPF